MITAINENCYFVSGVVLVWEMKTFLLLGRILFPSKGGNLPFGGKGRAVHTWWGQQVR